MDGWVGGLMDGWISGWVSRWVEWWMRAGLGALGLQVISYTLCSGILLSNRKGKIDIPMDYEFVQRNLASF